MYAVATAMHTVDMSMTQIDSTQSKVHMVVYPVLLDKFDTVLSDGFIVIIGELTHNDLGLFQ